RPAWEAKMGGNGAPDHSLPSPRSGRRCPPYVSELPPSTSSQSLRAQVGTLPPERAAAVEREHVEPGADLQPASIETVGLEDDEHDQDQAEHDRLQAGLRNGLGDPPLRERDAF